MSEALRIAIGEHCNSIAVVRFNLHEAPQAGHAFGCADRIDVLFGFPPLHFNITFLTLSTNGTGRQLPLHIDGTYYEDWPVMQFGALLKQDALFLIA